MAARVTDLPNHSTEEQNASSSNSPGKLTLDLEQIRLDDISQTWEYLKTGPPRKLVVTP